MIELLHGDCLELMRDLPDNSVDMILCDLPYGTTACKWDSVIPFEPLWAEYRRISKPSAAIVLTASQPFTSTLVMSNPTQFRHQWYWDKKRSGSFVQAKRMPMKHIEDVLVFSLSGQPQYHPIMVARDKPMKVGGRKASSKGEAIPNRSHNTVEFLNKVYTESYPKTIIEMAVPNTESGLHPTQKPVSLMEYLIRTYTNEGGMVLDNCMGSGTTGVACKNTGRNFIGIERDENYFNIARDRIYGSATNSSSKQIAENTIIQESLFDLMS